MTSVSTNIQSELMGGRSYEQDLWYAGCTESRHEKTVAEHLRQRGIEHFLPLYHTVHRWKNGRHHLQLPLFPGYIFVRMTLMKKLRVLEVPGFARLVSFGGLPFPIEDSAIEAMRVALDSGMKVEPYPYLTAGTRVEICGGPLQGVTGILLRRQGLCRVVLSVDLIMRSMVVEVDAADVAQTKVTGSAMPGDRPLSDRRYAAA